MIFDEDEENSTFQQTRQKDRPKSLHIQASRVVAANYRSLETGTKVHNLANLPDTVGKTTVSLLYCMKTIGQTFIFCY